MQKILSKENPTVKLLKKLQMKKYRLKYGLFIVEGYRDILEAVVNKAKIKNIVISEQKIDFLNEIDNNLKKTAIILPEDIFDSISTVSTPQGIAAIIEIEEYAMHQILENTKGFFIILDSLQDPGNMGTIIRSASAAGADAVIIGKGSVDPYSPKVVSSTMGFIFQIPVLNNAEISDIFKYLKENNYMIYGADVRAEDYYFDKDLTGPLALVIGNENKGLSQDTVVALDSILKIPLSEKAESLNAGVAASIVMFDRVRQIKMKNRS